MNIDVDLVIMTIDDKTRTVLFDSLNDVIRIRLKAINTISTNESIPLEMIAELIKLLLSSDKIRKAFKSKLYYSMKRRNINIDET